MHFAPTAAPEVLTADGAGNMASAFRFVLQEMHEVRAVRVTAAAVLMFGGVDLVSTHLLFVGEGLHAVGIGALDAVNQRHDGRFSDTRRDKIGFMG